MPAAVTTSLGWVSCVDFGVAASGGAALGRFLDQLIRRGSYLRLGEIGAARHSRQRREWSRCAPLILAAVMVLITASRLPTGAAGVVAAAATLFLVLAMIDLDVHRLPNALTLPAYPLVLAAITLAELSAGWRAESVGAIGRALLGGTALLSVYAALHVAPRLLARPTALGFGDVKLAGVLGLLLGWVGWAELIVGGYAGFVVSGLAGLVLLLRRRASRVTALAHGPPMVLGAGFAVIAGQMRWLG